MKKGKKRVKFSIVIPTYKEEAVISKTIRKLREVYPKAEIIIVDDSPDNKTIEEIKSINDGNLFYIKNKKPEGLSGSVIKGIKKAKNSMVFVVDADLQHPIKKIKDMCDIFEKHKDILVVLGERRIANKDLFRNLFSIAAIKLGQLSLFLRNKKVVNDPVSGFFGIRKKALKEIDERRIIKKGWKIAFDMIKQLPKERINSIYYKSLEKREEGKSKFGIKVMLYYILSLIS